MLHTVTLYEAALYAREIARETDLAEYRRQELYEVINRSLGGDFEADRGLVKTWEASRPQRKMTRGEKARGWIRMAEHFGVAPPQKLKDLARGE